MMAPMVTFSNRENGFPTRLLAVSEPPDRVWMQGSWDEQRPCVAIVGARACWKSNAQLAHHIAKSLGEEGISTVSGGALGIDAAAHQGAVEAHAPTCAVLGTGVDVAYPKRNQALFAQISNQGCLLSSFAPGSPPAAWRFPVRNQWIAALADVVLLIQSPPSSGSRYTAHTARLLGRPVATIAGCMDAADLVSAGTATPIDSIAQIMRLLPGAPTPKSSTALDRLPWLPTPPAIDTLAFSDDTARVAILLSHAPQDLGALSHRSGLPVSACAVALLELELQGRCIRLPGERYRLSSTPTRAD